MFRKIILACLLLSQSSNACEFFIKDDGQTLHFIAKDKNFKTCCYYAALFKDNFELKNLADLKNGEYLKKVKGVAQLPSDYQQQGVLYTIFSLKELSILNVEGVPLYQITLSKPMEAKKGISAYSQEPKSSFQEYSLQNTTVCTWQW
jgi:hypothetical protein